MIPDLGKYAGPVLAAYGGSILLYVVLIVAVIRKNKMAKRALDKAKTVVD
jgi:heme exporter protein D